MKTVKLAKRVGKAIAKQRKQAGITQAQVARELSIETETVSRLETGAISATLERLEQFSGLFGCSVEMFFQNDTEEVEGLAKSLAGMLWSLHEEERKLLLDFMVQTIKLFKRRA